MLRPASLLFAALFVVACGDDAPVMPDAAIAIDAAIDSPPPPSCAAPSKMCGASCLDVSQDEENCGDCGVECHGGEACDSTCACPAPFVPATIEPSSFDQFQAAGGITIAIAPTINGSVNPVLVGYPGDVPIGMDIDLSAVVLGDAPFVAAAYRFDLQTMNTDAAYVATAGTLRLTKACAGEVEGTLTNATFAGVKGGLTSPAVDPLGCTFIVPSITFHVMTTPCP